MPRVQVSGIIALITRNYYLRQVALEYKLHLLLSWLAAAANVLVDMHVDRRVRHQLAADRAADELGARPRLVGRRAVRSVHPQTSNRWLRAALRAWLAATRCGRRSLQRRVHHKKSKRFKFFLLSFSAAPTRHRVISPIS